MARSQAPQTPQTPSGTVPELSIESFAATHPFAVGTDPITLIATVRNGGKEALAAGVVSAKLVCAGSLDYLEGDTAPKLPAMEANASVSFRWRVQPVESTGALVVSLSLLYPGKMPVTRVLAIQHFGESPRAGVPSPGNMPVARAGGDWATIENGRIRVRVAYSESNVPAAFLFARVPSGWRQVAASVPLGEVNSAEIGQRPYWETFRVDSTEVANSKLESTLTLSGGIGLRWRATAVLTVRAGSSAVDTRLRLAPLRRLRLWGVRAWPLAVGDNLGDPAETTGPEPAGPAVLTAGRWGDATVGVLWSGTAMLPGWDSYPVSSPPGASYRLFGCEWRATGAPTEQQPGALTEIRERLFALAPSTTVEDARKVTLPAGR